MLRLEIEMKYIPGKSSSIYDSVSQNARRRKGGGIEADDEAYYPNLGNMANNPLPDKWGKNRSRTGGMCIDMRRR